MQLAYRPEEILREHDYARRHEEAGRRLHGGFDADGAYVSPRTAVRWDAVRAWTATLEARGETLLAADRSLLVAGSYPTYEQMKLLLANGLGRALWNSLTITGEVEGRGRFLVDFVPPDFADVVVEDVSERAVGHLGRGLLVAHGLDEGGDAKAGVGGHDAMWFAVRDLLFGADAYPTPTAPPRIGRPEAGRLAPCLPEAHERLLLLLMNVLMVEVRAEKLFDFTERLLRDPEVFADARDRAERGLALVRRIRADEAIHVAYLRVVLSELRGLSFRNGAGAPIPGHEILDPIWEGLVRWHGHELPRQSRAQARKNLRGYVREHPDPEVGEAVLAEFDALEPPPVGADDGALAAAPRVERDARAAGA
ncbi:MAG TPA: hypothetical protein VKB65_08395 [Myxococcota bacterium]|nr:hypothetical protein [Myxococcota bacterium]